MKTDGINLFSSSSVNFFFFFSFLFFNKIRSLKFFCIHGVKGVVVEGLRRNKLKNTDGAGILYLLENDPVYI